MVISNKLTILYFTISILSLHPSNISNTVSNKYINTSFIKLKVEFKLKSNYNERLETTNQLLKELNCEYLKMQLLTKDMIKGYIQLNIKRDTETGLLNKKGTCKKRCLASKSNCTSCAKLSKILIKLLLEIKELEELISRYTSEYKRCLDIQYRHQVSGYKYVSFGIYTPRKCTKREWLQLSLSYNSYFKGNFWTITSSA
ncbi:hypothetical protein cand_001760 [Cryptosporidium andersoni]|uniref:Uncharacterized protein n=1 Tax=Cryptosporidium andersoni TaxID=117008 RepID=A0A1J4MQW8_9CRYT|nr:hypothetical protein cand_001760 [Cryptosporidium andersoni]